MLLKKKEELEMADIFPVDNSGNAYVPPAEDHSADVPANTINPNTGVKTSLAANSAVPPASSRRERLNIQTSIPTTGEEKDMTPASWLNAVFSEAVRLDASDIHIVPEKDHISVQFRINGIMHEVGRWGIDYHEMVMSRIKVIAGMEVVEKNIPQDGHLELMMEALREEGDEKTSAVTELNYRVSTMPSINGEVAVLRALNKEGAFLRLEDLGLSPKSYQTMKKIVQRGHGVILITGHSGSGKTTTLYSILNYLNVKEKAILTLEDPVEYRIDNVRQAQVSVPTGFTFDIGLRSLLRQDPDIIMIGEIRDEETAGTAMRLALVGRLVLTTLHTNNISGAIVRLTEMDIANSIIASAFTGIVAQRLVRKICDNCRIESVPPTELLQMFNIQWTGEKVYAGQGCPECNHTGYKGRISIFEVLDVNDEFRTMIIQKAPLSVLEEYLKTAVAETLLEDGFWKVRQGITTLEEVIQAVI